MLTKPEYLLSLSEKCIFYNNENNDNDNSNNYTNNHNNYDNEMKFRNGKPTEDLLCSKKEKDKMIFSLPLFPFTDFKGVPFFPFF